MNVNFLNCICLFSAIILFFACGGSEGNFKQNQVDSSYADSVAKARMSELPIKSKKIKTTALKEGVFHGAFQRAKYTF